MSPDLYLAKRLFGINFWRECGFGLTIKTALNTKIKAANPSGPCAYIWEGLLSERYLSLRFWGGGIIFG